MATLSTVLSLRKPDGTDFVSRVNDLNNNWDIVDALFNTTTGHKHTGVGTNGPVVAINESQIPYDPVEAATLDTLSGSSMLINNLNRIRYYITQVSGQALGTVSVSLNAHVTNTTTYHGTTGFATNTIALGTAAAAGAATSLIRSDATIAAFDATTPAAVAIAGAVGAINLAARRDHAHAHGSLGTIANAHAAADITNAASLIVVNGFTKQYYAQRYNQAWSATPTVNWDNSNVQYISMQGNITTLTLSNPQDGARYILLLQQDATGGRTVAWPASVKWPGGTAPTLSGANKMDVIGLIYNGASTNYLASTGLNY